MRPIVEWVLVGGSWYLLLGINPFNKKKVRILMQGEEGSIPKRSVEGWKLA